MADESPSIALDLTLIILGVLAFIATLIVYLINSPEAWQSFDKPGLEHRESTMRGLVFSAGPGVILFCLGIGLLTIHKRGQLE